MAKPGSMSTRFRHCLNIFLQISLHLNSNEYFVRYTQATILICKMVLDPFYSFTHFVLESIKVYSASQYGQTTLPAFARGK